MKKLVLFLLHLVVLMNFSLIAQINKLPYPIIFVHGLKSSDKTFKTTLDFLNEHYHLGPINVYDVVLNADNDKATALMSEDVKWEDFEYGGCYINVGRRNYADDIDDMQDGWSPSNIFAINFQEERIRGANGFWNDYFDLSDQAAIYKQGYALAQMIREVLDFTGADKVVLVGHSMGGMAIREYLQRTNSAHTHINWINPFQEKGHKVAKVITLGTPHLGSNTGLDPTKSSVLNDKSEAVRDLKWAYDSYTNCNGSPVGIYLFGGNENCIASTDDNTTFYNNDINCNGSTTDNIIGVDFATYDNPAMPLPENIPYLWVTSIWSQWNGLVGDGAVEISCQWLRVDTIPAPLGIADTMLTDVFHTSEPDDYYTIIRALDVPGQWNFSYELKPDTQYIEFVTYQPGMNDLDEDAFFIKTTPGYSYTVTLDHIESGIGRIEIYDNQHQLIHAENIFYLPAQITFTPSEPDTMCYLKILGHATPLTYLTPYSIKIQANSLSVSHVYQKDIQVFYARGALHFSSPVSGKLQIISSSGQILESRDLAFNTQSVGLFLKNGIYLFRITNNTRVYSGKFVVADVP